MKRLVKINDNEWTEVDRGGAPVASATISIIIVLVYGIIKLAQYLF